MHLCRAERAPFEDAAAHPAGRIQGLNGQGFVLKKVSEDFIVVDAVYEIK